MGVNEFADLTSAEFKASKMGRSKAIAQQTPFSVSSIHIIIASRVQNGATNRDLKFVLRPSGDYWVHRRLESRIKKFSPRLMDDWLHSAG